jgi:hypothetical protein
MDINNPEVEKVMAVQERHTDILLKNPEVVGTATGLTTDGRLAILVLTKSQLSFKQLSRSANPIPQSLEGIPVRLYFAGEIRAMQNKLGRSFDNELNEHVSSQAPPISLGVSGGWSYDLANGYCCGGTLGSLISIDGKLHILSTYHVLEADIIKGGNDRLAKSGDLVIHPGLLDAGCNSENTHSVAKLVRMNSLPESNVDAAIAEVIPGMVKTDGSIIGIGTISSRTLPVSLKQVVKKSGRATGVTKNRVEGINATVTVTYANECVGGFAFSKKFTGQILIKNRGSKFMGVGDSGSLMVEDVDSNPRAVGLLFASSSAVAVANPIDEVLKFLDASMVGK